MADAQRGIRIGDAERTAAAQELGEHFAQGRLTPDEHQERLDRVMGARTAAELAPLFADLPGSPYQARAYAAADGPPVGSDSSRGGRPYPTRPFGPPPYAGGRGWFGMLPFPVKLLLVLIVAAVLLTHLPLVLIGLVVWVVLGGKHRRWHGYGHRRT